MSDKARTWLVTGCSSGLGHALAKELIAQGQRVFVTARDPAQLAELVDGHDNATALKLDVTSAEDVAAAVAQVEQAGGVDVLVNNAGYGYRAAVEEGEDARIAQLFATNVFGPLAMIKAVLPGMRSRRSGTIVNITSIAARLAMPGSGFYSATKFAMEGLSDALRREVEPLGIRVLIVEPGAFRTEFAGRSLQGTATAIDDYAKTVGPRRKENDKTGGTQPGDPARAARVLVELIGGNKLPVRLLLGSDAVKIVGDEVNAQRREIDEWTAVSATTDFPAAS
ncbi:NAD(P)-dependent dehydrogenase (short-subunit alcohol dehydrogenase family) [Rhodopseudomonas rhenobacensis]|uniref:NAD(P)-dependent dehydrogenase (Short-subunit alcohol dehydrogenase family) n=1 Tax=Rhodopseudomonas rhenobacensis TaxID=87461 RepID=A0A7W7Z2L6_9BRAD|nr:oxidoreductase [Rhodopseudomonas rhenobacensis]MBB5046635.1 NAD(P)-dependent dehydrogenase (short-subunit alcohol dehydrogenase family) [Rhodopseudomonas rhenobacensis]